MKSNGRRAWRRFAKQQRRKVNHRNRQSGTPFTARSLVGMTMGARKRALQKAMREDDYVVLRAKYLLGQKLRPCPGCMECDPRGFASICDGSGVLPARKSK